MRRRVLCGFLLTVICAALATAPARAQSTENVPLPKDALNESGGAAPCPGDVAAADVTADELRRPAASCYDVVALRVEFQPDTSRFTTGDGTFGGDLFGGLEPSIDPLPHDAAYFQAHLAFLKDYVARVSDGRTVVNTHLVPEVIRVPEKMGRYAPTGLDADSDEERAKLARLVHDAWTAGDEQSDFDMSGFVPERTALVIFHAGVGRDIELIGLSLDKTPEDLPSLYFGTETLERLGAGGASFNGFPIDHSMVVPRTETRLGTDFIANESFLLELSINGMLAASFFNFLGAPDLFDVESGESAIGPFGLMDAQGIFAYGGLFPPEPMAWTKYYLGWTDPTDLRGPGPQSVNLRAMSLPDASESARALISDAEYFLVENRFRDPERDGLTLRVWKDGEVTEQHIENGDESFNSLTVGGFIGGVVVGVDNYDWALPGGLDEADNELNGGILIWHIDERRLRAGLKENAVNVGSRRAVDIEEADGAQDIGFPSDNPFAPRADLGTPFDFFYQGNPVFVETTGGREIRLYENRFGPGTFPGSETNAGGPSFIVLEAFSEPATDMSFLYRLEAVEGLEAVPSDSLETLQAVMRSENVELMVGSSVIAGSEATVVYDRQASRVYVSGDAPHTYASLTHPIVSRDELVRVHPTDDGLAITSVELETHEERWSTPFPPGAAGMLPRTPLVRVDREGRVRYYVVVEGDGRRELVSASAAGSEVESVGSVGAPLALAAGGAERPIIIGDAGAGYLGQDPIWTFSLSTAPGQPVFGQDAEGLVGVLPLPQEGTLRMLQPNGSVRDVDVAASAAPFGASGDDGLTSYPVPADFDGDGRLDVLAAYGRWLFAFTQAGAIVADFPIDVGAEVVAQPLVVRRGDGEEAVLAPAMDGYLYGFTAGGRHLGGFPLEVGYTVPTTPSVAANRLTAVSGNGTLKTWRWSDPSSTLWGRLYGDAGNTSFAALSVDEAPVPSEALIDGRETYNWPNPIQDGVTHLRIRTARDARVEVTIINSGGSLVHNIDMGEVDGGVPTEAVWQADRVQSGLYFARFTATTADGERDTRLVKMAVIR